MNGQMYGVKRSKVIPKLINSILIIVLVILFTKISLFERIFFQGTSLYDFDLYYILIENIKNSVNPYSPWLIYTVGPPLLFLYYFPFSFLKLTDARILVTIINIASGFILCFLLGRKFNKKYLLTTFLTLSIIFFSAFLPRFALGNGQPSILITLLITLVIISKNSFWKGIFLALAASIKTIFLFPVLSFLKDKKFLIAITLSFFLLTLISLTFIKIDWYIYFFQKIFPDLNNSPTPLSGLDYYNQSLKSTFFRLGIIDSYKFLFFPILVVASLLLIIMGSFELSVIATILLSPVSWQHYFTILFPIFVLVFFTMKKNIRNLSVFTLAFILWFIEFPWIHNTTPNLLSRLLASHYFISGFLLSFSLLKKK